MKPKTLSLKKHTLYELTTDELAAVAGAAEQVSFNLPTRSCVSCCERQSCNISNCTVDATAVCPTC